MVFSNFLLYFKNGSPYSRSLDTLYVFQNIHKGRQRNKKSLAKHKAKNTTDMIWKIKQTRNLKHTKMKWTQHSGDQILLYETTIHTMWTGIIKANVKLKEKFNWMARKRIKIDVKIKTILTARSEEITMAWITTKLISWL